MLELLRGGPATASMLARELDESSGATSYHLRELEKVGFVEDDPERRSGRERWWRRSVGLVVVPSDPADDAEYASALAQLRSVIVERDDRALAHYFATVADEPSEWQEASFLGGWSVYATPEEIAAFGKLIFEEVGKLQRKKDERPPDARAVHVTFRAMIQPGD
jgi:DNA-binding transcriptional ArsR family regulator